MMLYKPYNRLGISGIEMAIRNLGREANINIEKKLRRKMHMQKMSKEELIEYFIEILGDNHVLGKYFSINEIRERLNQDIKNVTYEPEKGNRAGHYGKG